MNKDSSRIPTIWCTSTFFFESSIELLKVSMFAFDAKTRVNIIFASFTPYCFMVGIVRVSFDGYICRSYWNCKMLTFRCCDWLLCKGNILQWSLPWIRRPPENYRRRWSHCSTEYCKWHQCRKHQGKLKVRFHMCKNNPGSLYAVYQHFRVCLLYCK